MKNLNFLADEEEVEEEHRWDLETINKARIKRLSNLFLVSKEEQKTRLMRKTWRREEQKETEREAWLLSFNK